MNDDDIFKRLWQSVLLVVGLFIFNYLMIVGTQNRPTAYALAIVQITDKVFHWIKLCIGISAISTGPISLAIHLHKKKKKEIQRQEEEKQKFQENLLSKQRETEEADKERLQKQQERIEREKEQQRQTQLRLEKEKHLKNRNADEANKEALKHFM